MRLYRGGVIFSDNAVFYSSVVTNKEIAWKDANLQKRAFRIDRECPVGITFVQELVVKRVFVRKEIRYKSGRR